MHPRHAVLLALLPAALSSCAGLPPGSAVDVGWEQAMAAELNLLRSDPGGYADRYIRPLESRYRGSLLFYPGYPATMSREGAAAVRECVEALRELAPRPALATDGTLTRLAREHVADTGALGLVGHYGSDGSDPRERAARADPALSGVGEAIHYGRGDARRVVISLLVDDGVPDRGHRWGILDPVYRLVGAATGPHRDWGRVSVLVFAAGRAGL